MSTPEHRDISVVGIDGCPAGWVAFAISLPSRKTSVELIDLPSLLRQRSAGHTCVAIDIPIGLLDGPRAYDGAARKLLGWPRRNSVFTPPCRAALQAATYVECCSANQKVTDKKVSRQAWGIAAKIKQIDDVITPECQTWAFEVHPEVSFWALAGHPMTHKKKIKPGVDERLDFVRPVFPNIDKHLEERPSGVHRDDVLDAAIAGWTALRFHHGEARKVCEGERDPKGLLATIWY